MKFCLITISLTFAFAVLVSHVHAAERFAAMLSDGTRVEEAEVREWFEPNSHPKVAGRQIFDAKNPARWIIDRQQTSSTEAPMFVEFFGGDRLAGEVMSFRPDSGNPYEHLPPHLIVKPLAELQPAEDPVPSDIRVGVDWLRRVVWQRRGGDEYRPGTVWLRGGGMLSFRTLRWSADAVTLLTSEGVKELSFGELGEIHLPKIDSWGAYYEQLAVLSPQLKSRLIQMETSDGSRLTTSTERFQGRHHGDRNRHDHWYQLLQPAWSLDPVWLRYRTIRLWRFHAPIDVPLSDMWPIDIRRDAVFGAGWNWRANQNVQRGPLQSANQEFGWGFGVQATCDLSFDYPEAARSFRTQFGLDRSAGTGGYAKISFTVGNGQSIGPQPNLLGSVTVGDTNWLPLPTVAGDQRRLALKADMAHNDRPPETDPFDVRDAVNWYEPEIRLDQAALAAEVSAKALSRLNGLHGWTMLPADMKSLNLSNWFDGLNGHDPQFRLVAAASDRFYIASRKLKVAPQQRWLSIIASRFNEATPSTIQVRINDRSLGEFDVPIRNAISDPDPILVPVDDCQGKTVHLELVVFPTDEKSHIDWRGMALTSDRPGLRTIFEDDPGFVAQLNRGRGTVEISEEKPFSGSVSLKVTPDAGETPQIPGLEATICDQPRLGQYRYVLFAWRQPTGTRLELQFANDGRFGDFFGLGGRRGAVHSKPPRGQIRYEGQPEDRGLRHSFAYSASTPRKPPATTLLWRAIDPQTFTSSDGATLTKLPDGSILSGGAHPERDTVTIVAPVTLNRVTAVKLEVLLDDSLPHKGPGRQDNGNLNLSEFEVYVDGTSTPIPLMNPRADFNEPGWGIESAIDTSEDTGWGIFPDVGQPHAAAFDLKEPLAITKSTKLKFVLKQRHGRGHLIGRTRVLISDAEPPVRLHPLAEPVAAINLNSAMPKDWQFNVRDIFGDFGAFNLTGLALRCVDGDAAWFDHIYLARTPQDMEFAKTYLVNPIPPPQARNPAELDFAYLRGDYSRVLNHFAPMFSARDLVHGLFRLREHGGQLDVLRTDPNAQDKPCVLRTGLVLPKDKPQVLDMRVSHHPQSDWVLVVKINGETVLQETINEKLTIPQKGWANVQVDLSKYAGQKVYIEVLNQANNWSYENGFWKRIMIIDK